MSRTKPCPGTCGGSSTCTAGPEKDGRLLVVVQLEGGNDGIKTVSVGAALDRLDDYVLIDKEAASRIATCFRQRLFVKNS